MGKPRRYRPGQRVKCIAEPDMAKANGLECGAIYVVTRDRVDGIVEVEHEHTRRDASGYRRRFKPVIRVPAIYRVEVGRLPPELLCT